MHTTGTGHIGDTIVDSVPHWPLPKRPDTDAPNVLMIVLDDVGFAQLGCYGASIQTPAVDRLASEGLRYTNFHVTSLCSTTRASLITGRNHHSVGMGFLAGFDSGYPSYRGHVSNEAATVAQMLQDVGYGTYALGKWHLTPPAHMNSAGPFDHWPLGRGFDRYYGFLWGEDDQWSPQLWHDNHFVDPPTTENYHLSDDLVERAQHFLRDHLTGANGRPFFLYLAFGAAHAPHQAPPAFISKYRGKFDHGWDAERERVLSRQLKSGLVPKGTILPPRNADVRPWADLAHDERILYARMQEVFAGVMEHTDAAISRIISFLQASGELDNTLVILLSDNGASGQGGTHGTFNEYRHLVGIPDSLERNLEAMDELGGPYTHSLYPSGWAQAGNTPLRLYKKYNYGGGVRAPLVVRWPRHFMDKNALRTQFQHVVDVTPTILEACGVEAKASYAGVPQLPIHGRSFVHTFRTASAPSRRSVQYFEIAGHRGIWAHGWKAVTNHVINASYADEPWELFDTERDFSESVDLSKKFPDKLEEMKSLWWREARAYGALPLDDRFQERATDRGPDAFRSEFRVLPGTRSFTPIAGPNFANRSFTISAALVRGSRVDEGVLLAYGRRAAGFALFVQNNRLILDYNCAGDHHVVECVSELPTGRLDVQCRFVRVRDGEADVSLHIQNERAARARVKTMMGGFGSLSTQCGHNAPSPVSSRYASPFTFTGTLSEVTIMFHDEANVAVVEEALGQD